MSTLRWGNSSLCSQKGHHRRQHSCFTPSAAVSSSSPAPPNGPKYPTSSHPKPPFNNKNSTNHEYHRISTHWNVQRTPLSHYPEETQRVIRQGQGRNRSKSPTTSPSPSETSLTNLSKSITQCLDVLEFEKKHGWVNIQGRTGARFSQWMIDTLRDTVMPSLNSSNSSNRTVTKEVLANVLSKLETYDRYEAGSVHRQGVVDECTQVLIAAHAGRSAQEHQRTARYTREKTEIASLQPKYNDDAEAVQAHEEETNEIVSRTTPQPSTTTPHMPSTTTTAILDAEEDTMNRNTSIDGTDYVMVGNRKVKASTVAFRQSFAQAAAQQEASSSSSSSSSNLLRLHNGTAHGEQRTEAWLSLRERRLTASAFAKALGFFSGDRQSLWEEKVGLRLPFAGNEATAWGTKMEPRALSTYQALTSQHVESCMFRVKHDDPPHGWLGASPDGLVQGLVTTAKKKPTARYNDYYQEQQQQHDQQQGNNNNNDNRGPGILEIKCPYNKGRPELAVPPQHAIWYYMPQIQGLMDIFDRPWCSLYIWTPCHGSVSFVVDRDREYWAAVFEVLAEFWWAHVVPARQAYERGASREEIESYRPLENHPDGERLRQWSKTLARQAQPTFYPAYQLPESP